MKKFFKYTLLAIVGFIVIYTFYFLYSKSKPKETVYELVEMERHTIVKRTVATGKVEPRYEILIKPQINGIITHLYKEAGQTVRVNDVIARVQVVPEMGMLNAAENRVNMAEISFNQAERDFERLQTLHKNNVIAREEFEQGEMNFKRAKEELQAAKDNLDIIKTGVSARSEGYSTTNIRSTVSGLILDIPVKVGTTVLQANNFNEGTTIAVVANMNDMIFRGEIDETEIGKIHQGTTINITLGALENVNLKANLEFVSPKGVEKNGAIMFEIRAAIAIPDTVFIRAGYSANAEIITAQRDSVMTIPESSVEFSGDSAFVYVLTAEKPKQEFEKRPIEIGLSDGLRIEILSGIGEGDRIRGAIVTNKKR
ncbi:MAG: efflux RND transporter periplasmic adaptor subunit [Bacteroidales bacterium]|jgi:HlyD family secretion protein|nr:efflux RND transporter periplasmic adaptor subunit [Bacteroidales bacterium]